jgi:tetratricopeptide (TPR) repeat protein
MSSVDREEGESGNDEKQFVNLFRRGVSLFDNEAWQQALEAFTESYRHASVLLPKRTLDVANIQVERSRCLCLLSCYGQAEVALREVDSLLKQVPPEVKELPIVLRLWAGYSEALANLRRYQGRYAEGLAIIEQAMATLKDLSGLAFEYHQLMIHRGMLQKYLGNYEMARNSYLASLDYHSASENPSKMILADIYYNLSGACHAQEKVNDGVRYGIQAFRLRAEFLAQGQSTIALTLSIIAANLILKKYFKLATRLVQKSLVIQRGIYGEQNRDIAMNLNHLGVISYSIGDLSQADSYFLTAFEMQKKCLDQFHPDLVVSLNNLLTVKLERQELEVIPEYQAAFKELLEKNSDLSFRHNPKLLVAPSTPSDKSPL